MRESGAEVGAVYVALVLRPREVDVLALGAVYLHSACAADVVLTHRQALLAPAEHAWAPPELARLPLRRGEAGGEGSDERGGHWPSAKMASRGAPYHRGGARGGAADRSGGRGSGWAGEARIAPGAGLRDGARLLEHRSKAPGS